MLGMLVLVLGFAAAQVKTLLTWCGAWRLGATVPGLVFAFVVTRIVVDTSRDASSHNLWPFEVVVWSGLGLVALGVLAFARPHAKSHGHGA